MAPLPPPPPVESTRPALEPGSSIDRFVVIRGLGRGRFGEVALVTDSQSGRSGALKLLYPDKITGKPLRERFIQSAEAKLVFSHKNLTGLIAAGEFAERPYVVSDYVSGETLRQREHNELLPFAYIYRIALGIAQALIEAEKNGLVHLDLRPENVFITADGTVRVTDVGLTRLVRNAAGEKSAAVEGNVGSAAEYFSPELWRGENTGPAADIWSLGIILFELCSGKPPHKLTSIEMLGSQVTNTHRVRALPTEPRATPDVLAQLIYKCLEKDPAQRPSAKDVADVLMRLAQTLPASDTARPFAGLAPVSDPAFFFGRDDERAALYERLRTSPLLTVVGAKGVGKTSLILAGLVLPLDPDWLVLSVRPGQEPLRSLVNTVIGGESSELHERWIGEIRSSPQRLHVLLRKRVEQAGKRVVLFVDQLEEVVTLASAEDRHAYLAALAVAANHVADPIRIVLAVREDFLSALSAGGELGSQLGHIFTLHRPDAQALRQMVEGPLSMVGGSFDDPSVIEQLVPSANVLPTPLPLLSFILSELWERDRPTLHRDHYDAMGGVERALAGHCDRLFADLDDAKRRVVRDLSLRLVGDDGALRSVPKDQLLEGLPATASELLDRLKGGQLAVEWPNGNVSLAHDVLVDEWPALRQWLDDSRSDVGFLREVGEAAHVWQQGGAISGQTWQGTRLDAAVSRLVRTIRPPGEEVVRFLDAGRKRALKKRLIRGVAIAAVWIALVIFGLAALAFARRAAIERQAAIDLERQTLSQRVDAQLEDAHAATARSAANDGADLLEARGQLRSAFEQQDSSLARAVWGELSAQPLVWKKVLAGEPQGLALSADGRQAAVGVEQSVLLLSTTTATSRVLRGGHQAVVSAVAFAGPGVLLSADRAGKIVVWDLKTGKSDAFASDADAVTRLAAGGGVVAASNRSDDVQLWTVANKTAVGAEIKNAGHVLAFSADGKLLAGSGRDGKISLIETATGAVQKTLTGGGRSVAALAFSADGSQLSAANNDGEWFVWSLAATDPPKPLHGLKGVVVGAAFSADGKRLSVIGTDNVLTSTDIAEDKAVRLRLAARGTAGAAVFSSDGRHALSTHGGTLRYWDTEPSATVKHSEHRATEWPKSTITDVAFSPNGNFFVSVGEDRQIYIWDVAEAAVRKQFGSHDKPILSLDISRDGRLIATGSADGSAAVWDIATGTQLKQFKATPGPVKRVRFIDAKTLAAGHADGRVRLWNIINGKAKMTVSAPGSFAVAFSPDGKRMVTATAGGSGQVWKVASGQGGRSLISGGGKLASAAFSLDGKLIATGSSTGKVLLWKDAGPGKPMAGGQGAVNAITFDRQSRRVAAAMADHTVMMWDVESGQASTYRGLPSAVTAVAFSEDGRFLLGASDDGQVRMWDTSTGLAYWRAPVLSKKGPELLTHAGFRALSDDKPGPVSSWRRAAQDHAQMGAESPNGSVVCLAGQDKIEAWDTAQNTQLFSVAAPRPEELLATDQGCLALTAGNVELYASAQGQITDVSTTATAISLTKDGFIVAEGDKAVLWSAQGQKGATLPSDAGASAIAKLDDAVVVGFTDGGLERIALPGGERSFPFSSAPTGRVWRLLDGPVGTVAAADVTGAVGVWDGRTGRLLKSGELHGRPTQLSFAGGDLYAASETGAWLSFDLSALSGEYCPLLKQVWQKVPNAWFGGKAIESPVRTEHVCLAPPVKAH